MAKSKPRVETAREDRIIMEIVVDAYDETERAMGWYYYLENELAFPFKAVCVAVREVSPLRLKENVEVIGLPDLDECMREVFVTIQWEGRELAVPLMQLKPAAGADEKTVEAVGDWHYWVKQGYGY